MPDITETELREGLGIPKTQDLTIKLELTSEDLHQALLKLAQENKRTMATIKANSSEPNEEFALSELDYDELLEVYGDDPVLMTIFNRMKDFFRSPTSPYERIPGWPGSSPYISGDPEKYLRWDTTTTDHTVYDTTSKVSDTFTLKTTSTGEPYISKDVNIKYSIE